MTNNTDGFYGTQRANDGASEYNAMLFTILQVLATRHHCAVVQVKAVDGGGGALALAGKVDVQPMVNQQDGEGNAIPHGVINGLTYMRMQGGKNGIIMDPEVGDLGLAVFADRDSSSVVATRAAANPGSGRQADMADGFYIGGILNGIPEQYVQFLTSGIKIYSPTSIALESPGEITLTAPVITMDASTSATITTPTFTVNGESHLNGAVTASSTIDAGGQITAPEVVGGGKSLSTHRHQAQGATAITTAPL